MEKRILFLRPIDYNYQIGTMDLYDSFERVAQKLEDPHIPPESIQKATLVAPKELKEAQIIYTSSANRTYQTAEVFTSHPVVLPELTEIDYSMTDFIAKEEFYGPSGKPDVNKARTRFFTALTQDSLQESFQSVISRIKSMLAIVKESPYENVAVITHGFLLAVIEGYIRDPEIEQDPKRFLTIYDGSVIPHRFLEGFVISFNSENSFTHFTIVEQSKE